MSTIQKRYPKSFNDNIEIEKELFKNDSAINLLEQLGFDEWFQKESKPILKDDFSIARIIEVNKNNYKVSNGSNEVFAELTGRYVFNATNNIDYPTIGDWVIIQYFDNNSHAIIHDIIVAPILKSKSKEIYKIELQIFKKELNRYELLAENARNNAQASSILFKMKEELIDGD